MSQALIKIRISGVSAPRSGKVRFRGLGVTGRLALCDYWDGEPPEDMHA